MDKAKIAWLWLVRQNQPVSLDDLLGRLESGIVKVPVDLEDFRFPSYLGRSAEYEVRTLLEAGLLMTEGNQPLNPDSKLRLTPTMNRVQDFFSISLTNSLTRSDTAIWVDPLFGRPKARGTQFSQVFVAMPFTDNLKPVYSDHILKVAQALGVTCKRGDDFFTTHSIMTDVWSAIYHSDICIVDCTGRNPNVFYELGIAHTLGRKAILIAQSIDDIPFDVRHLRTIVYQYTPPGMQQFEATLKKTLQAELGLDTSE